MKREKDVESALCWAKSQGFSFGKAALDEYCANRDLTWTEDYAGVVSLVKVVDN